MKYPLPLFAILGLIILSSLPAEAQDTEPELDAEALATAKVSFDKKFVQKEGSFVEKCFTSYGYSQDFLIMQFKGLYPTVLREHLSDTDKMNGVSWRGQVSFEAVYQRNFTSEGTAHRGLKAGDWSHAHIPFSIQIEKRGGKWTSDAPVAYELTKPTDADLHEFDLGLQQLPPEDKSRSSDSWRSLFADAANGYARALAENSYDLLILEMPTTKIKALGGFQQASKAVHEDCQSLFRAKVEVQQIGVRPLKEAECALGVARLAYHIKDKTVERNVIGYSNSGGLYWWFVGTSNEDQGFLRAASGGRLPASPLAAEKDGQWVLSQ